MIQKKMKPITLTISMISVLINTFWFVKDSQATPNNNSQIANINGQEFLHYLSKSDLKAPSLISKDNEFLSKDLEIKLNPVKIKNTAYEATKKIQSESKTSNIKFVKSEFKNTFKDSSSSFTSNYGPVTRAPDESLQYCTTKACFE